MDKIDFIKNAQTAIRKGKKERAALAQTQADNFVSGNAEFDPRTLRRLGGNGLAVFLKAVRERGIACNQLAIPAPHTQSETPSGAVASPPGWVNKQCAEPNWTVRGITRGLLLGFGLIVLGSTCLTLFNY